MLGILLPGTQQCQNTAGNLEGIDIISATVHHSSSIHQLISVEKAGTSFMLDF